MKTVKVKLHWGGQMPIKGTVGSNGYDIHARGDLKTAIQKSDWRTIPTGVYLEMPEGVYAWVTPRSGMAARYGITVLNSPGLVDTDYRGEVAVILINHGDSYEIAGGDRIAQLVFSEPVILELAQELTDTGRGVNGFGSTGR